MRIIFYKENRPIKPDFARTKDPIRYNLAVNAIKNSHYYFVI